MRFRTDLHSSFPGWSVQASLQGRNNEGVTLLRSLLPTCSVPACCHPYYDIVLQMYARRTTSLVMSFATLPGSEFLFIFSPVRLSTIMHLYTNKLIFSLK